MIYACVHLILTYESTMTEQVYFIKFMATFEIKKFSNHRTDTFSGRFVHDIYGEIKFLNLQ